MKEKETPQLPVSEQEIQIQPPSILDKIKVHKFKIMEGIFAIFVAAGIFFVGYKLGQKKFTVEFLGPQLVPTLIPVVTPTPTLILEVTPTPKTTPQPISIPKDWREYTATDPDFGIKTTLSLPPGFSFSFSGSEFTIQNADATELWDYSTSVFSGWSPTCDKNTIKFEDVSKCCLDDVRNYYSGESRRVWYEKLLNGDFSCIYPASDAKMGTITNVNEQAAGNTSYLEVTVDTKSSEKNETHYLYVQNNILHIIKPASHKANSATAQLPDNIGIVFYSLKSSRIK